MIKNLTILIIILVHLTPVMAVNIYNPATGLVTIDSIHDVLFEYKNVVVEPNQLISYNTTLPTSIKNTFDGFTGQITLYSVMVDTTVFSDVVFTLKKVVSSEPMVIPSQDNTIVRGSAYIPHCMNGSSPQPCLELVIENSDTLSNLCKYFLLNSRIKDNSKSLCPIDANFDWKNNRLIIVYSALEDCYVAIDEKSIYSCNIRLIPTALKYSDHWVLVYEILYPSQIRFNVEVDDRLGNISAIAIPNDGNPIFFRKIIPYNINKELTLPKQW